MTHRSRAWLLLLLAALAFGDVREARAQDEPLVVAQAFGARQKPDLAMRALLESLPREQRRAVVREMRGQPAAEREAWRKAFLAQPPEARQKQIEAWTANQQPAQGAPKTSPSADGTALRERLAAMSAEEREQLREQIAQLQELSPEERSALGERVARMTTATAAERARLDANLARWETLSPAERDRIRTRWRRFQALPPAERERILQQRAAP